MNTLEKILLSPVAAQYLCIGAYRRTSNSAINVGYRGPEASNNEFAFGQGLVGLVAQQGESKSISDLSAVKNQNSSGSEFAEPIFFESTLVGVLSAQSLETKFFTDDRVADIRELAKVIAPLLVNDIERNFRILQWLQNARDLAPELVDWIGIYFKESYVSNNVSTDLLLGPFLGLATEHVRIPIDRGFCGLALREERVVNVADVLADSRHIACSVSTRSEIVIPLKDSSGKFVAELDIDSNTLAAFPERVAEHFLAHAQTFAAII
jgi:putative methionine-R-sulfoxide reductase with GAF domain